MKKELDIINFIQHNKKGYAREIARELGLSHTNVNNALADMFENKVLQRKKIGKIYQYSIRYNNSSRKWIVMNKIYRDKDTYFICKKCHKRNYWNDDGMWCIHWS